MSSPQDTLEVDGVAFAVRWSRKRRTIGITIPRQGAPVVAAPAGCRRATVESAVRGKLPWVRRKLGERGALPQLAPPRRYVAGETLPYLGRSYRLVLSDDGGDGRSGPGKYDGGSRGRGTALALRQGRFVLPRSLAAHGREHLVAWYRRRAEHWIGARVAHFAPLTGASPSLVTVREMRSRWGSCTSRGRVSYHWGLVLLPPAIVDYVVVHELVHLRELNHGPRFWRALEEIMPDYRERRAWLRATAQRYAV
jgi:predicted metal-dependent hydrolase